MLERRGEGVGQRMKYQHNCCCSRLMIIWYQMIPPFVSRAASTTGFAGRGMRACGSYVVIGGDQQAATVNTVMNLAISYAHLSSSVSMIRRPMTPNAKSALVPTAMVATKQVLHTC